MLYENIERLCSLYGVSGCEEPVRYEILKLIEGKCIYKVDALGNVLAFKKGKRPPAHTLLFSAHMDEVGLIVTYLEEDGLLRFSAVGGIDRRILPGKAVLIGETYGVIGSKAVHLKAPDERDKAAEPGDLFIDIGAKDREDAARVVSPGDRAGFVSRYTALGDRLLCGRALDDRVGCALLVGMICSELEYDTHFAFTVQEETGATGARTAAFQVGAEIAVAVETTTACDIPGTPPEKVVCSLGKGPALSFMDKGTVYDRGLYRRALAAARAGGIACQPKEGVFGGNEARSVQVAGRGAKVLAVSVPCRYLHTPACVASRADIDGTFRLLCALDADFGG